MPRKEPKAQTFDFEKIINGNISQVMEDGDTLHSEATGKTITFDRKAPDFSEDLRTFLEAEARFGTILKQDVPIWLLWLADDGRASAATLMRGEATRARQAPSFYHWQSYDF